MLWQIYEPGIAPESVATYLKGGPLADSDGKMDGKDVLVVNASHWMSEIGARLAPDCDFAMIWYWDHESKNTKVSLRAFHETADVSEISKKFGGGGHRKAAGFVLPPTQHPDSIFEKEKKPTKRKRKVPVKKAVVTKAGEK